MLLHDIALTGQHVVLAIDRAGIVGKDGATHQGVFDVSFLTSIPGMTVYAPASFGELEAMLREAICFTRGPAAVRYPRGGEGRWKGTGADSDLLLCRGEKITVVSYGDMINVLLDALDRLPEGTADLIKLGRIYPLDASPVLRSVERTGRLLVLEDVVERGSVGEALAAAVVEAGLRAETRLMNLGEKFIPHGDVATLRRVCGIDADAVENAIRTMTGAGCGKTEA